MAHTESKSYKRLKLKDFKLSILLEITKAINNNVSTTKLFEIFEYILRNQLSIGKAVLFSNNDIEWLCILKYGARGNEKRFDIADDLEHIREITVIESSSKDHLNSFDVVIPVYHKSHPLAYLLLGDMDENEIRISPIIKHLPFIQTLTNIIVVAIENKRLANESIRQERVKKELELASEMQAMLFPSSLPDNSRLQVSAFYKPHQQVGGDYYDFIHLNRNEVAFCLADVSGKGVSAALLMANFQANLRALINFKHSLIDLVHDLNDRVMSSAKGEKFITFFIAKYNKKTRTLTFVNAAHNPPLLCSEGEILQLKTGCTGLGMFETIPEIKEGTVQVAKDSVILCYTDGVVELENDDEIEFGTERLKKFVKKNCSDSMENLNHNLAQYLEEYRGTKSYIDDIALLSCKFL